MSELVAEGLSVTYGGIRAVRDVHLRVQSGRFTALVGANGAGKSSIVRAMMGLVAGAGSVSVDGYELLGHLTHKRRAHGISFVPEGRGIFQSLTVRDNLLLGGYGLKRGPRDARLAAVCEIFPILADRIEQMASSLSGGEQQMLALARALMPEPAILLCDEPSMGLAPLVAKNLFHLMRDIAAQGTAVLVADENARRAIEVADELYVMRLGSIVASGRPDQLGDLQEVSEIYFGSGPADGNKEAAPE